MPKCIQFYKLYNAELYIILILVSDVYLNPGHWHPLGQYQKRATNVPVGVYNNRL